MPDDIKKAEAEKALDKNVDETVNQLNNALGGVDEDQSKAEPDEQKSSPEKERPAGAQAAGWFKLNLDRFKKKLKTIWW